MILYGASGHGKVIFDILKLNKVGNIEIWDDNPEKKIFNEKTWLPNNKLISNSNMIIAIGSNRIRYSLALKTNVNFKFVNAIHPSAIVSYTACLGGGTVVMAGAIINSSSKIGNHCIINTASIIEHDCVIDDFCHISPNSSIAGSVTIGEGTHVGINATVIQGIKIGKWATIGAGAVVIKDVPDYSVVVGIPGKVIKYNQILDGR